MKRIVKILGAVNLAILLLFVNCIQVSAKNFYDTKYGNVNTKKPYKKMNTKIAQINAGYYEGYRTACRKDFNVDGKKEKVVLSANVAANYSDGEVVLKINGKIAFKREISGNLEMISLSTMKVSGKCLAVLMFGDNDYAGGGASIFLWKKNNKIKLLKSYKPKGYLDIYTGRDKTLNKDVLYIDDAQQLHNRYGEKWPTNVLKKYKKYANKEHTSVTKTT